MKNIKSLKKGINYFILFFLISLSAFSQGQLLCDEGFENSASNGSFPNSGCWSSSDAGGGADAGCTTTAKHNGSNGLWEYTGSETWAVWSGPFQEFSSSLDKIYQASVWLRTPSVDLGGSWVDGSKACIRIIFLNTSKSILAAKESSGLTSIGYSWTQFNIMTDPAPTGTAYVRFICYIIKPQGTSGISVANFDDCFFEEVPTVSTPTFNPSPDTYSSEQDVTISCTTSGTTIYYTTDGSDPTESSSIYSSPVHIVSMTTLKARAYKNGLIPSIITNGIYEITGTVSTPTFNPSPDIYTRAQDVTISCTTSGATIHYTTNGSDPTEGSSIYSSPVHIVSTTTLKARAYRSGWNPSDITNGIYEITGTVSIPTFNPSPDIYTGAQDVTISCTTSGATIHYTTNGSDPTEGSSIYSSPVHIVSTTILMARAYRSGWNPSDITNGIYEITGTVSTPTFNPSPDIYTNAQDVTISCATSGATIYYTTNGSDPTEGSSIYCSPVHIVSTATLKARAFKSDWNPSIITSGIYEITGTLSTPTFNPSPDVYTSAQDVTISCATSGATIHYTTNGSDPIESSPVYSSPVHIVSTTILKARAYRSGWNPSDITNGIYEITGSVSTPTFNPSPDIYTGAQDVTISCATSGAIIHYTTNGSDPTEGSSIYSSPVHIAYTTTLKARAYRSGWNPSIITSGIYEITATVSNFTGTPVSGPAPLSAQFTDLSTGTISSRLWYFGDDETSSSQNPVHIYKSAGTYSVSLILKRTDGKDTKTLKDYITVIPPTNSTSVENAYSHIKEQFDQYHTASYVYKDDNAGGNIYIPSIWQGGIKDIFINQSSYNDPFGRSCIEVIFPLSTDSSFSAIKYVYPENNIGNSLGFNMSGATELSFYAKGNGTVEFILGGMNRRPFYSDTLQYMDGVDIKSTGFIELKNKWEYHTIDLSDNTFWVYLDSTQGLNNKFLQPAYLDNYSFFHFYYDSDDGEGNTCMKLNWFGGTDHWAGVFLFPPECNWNSTQGYNLTGITKIRFKAKISQTGKVRFLFGKEGDSSGPLTKDYTLNTDWQWYEWVLPSYLDYSNIIGGFGFYFGGNIRTPDTSNTYIDSVYYEGIKLANDFSNLICGFTVSANKNMNSDSVKIYLDEIKYNKRRTENARFCQSFVCSSDTMDITLKNRADLYDNSLKLLADLVLYNATIDSQYLLDAKLTGDAFIFAIQNDRYFKDGRLRNAYMSGEIEHWNGTVRIPGWWDDVDKKWYEDIACVSTYTGNIAWAGLALISLYEATHETKYLEASQSLAIWCKTKTQTNLGFTGGFIGWGETGQDSIKWKSTEHNIDLYALYKRLYLLTSNLEYENAAFNAKNFVLSMWNSEGHYFWTGTIDDGVTVNKSNIPLDIQGWYIMAFLDSTSEYSSGIDWANINCYLKNFKSPNYTEHLSGYDFNTDLDGIWFEGSSQAVIANKMKGNVPFIEPVLSSIAYVQKNHFNKLYYNCNDKGIVAADHNHVSTGFDWEYNNRLHIGATSWFIFAELGINPYYISSKKPDNILTIYSSPTIVKIYPNPTTAKVTISIENALDETILSIISIDGRLIYTKEFFNSADKIIEILDLYNQPRGTYLIKVNNGKTIKTEKLIIE